MASNKTFTIEAGSSAVYNPKKTITGLPGLSPTSPTSLTPSSYCKALDKGVVTEKHARLPDPKIEVETTPPNSSINSPVVVVNTGEEHHSTVEQDIYTQILEDICENMPTDVETDVEYTPYGGERLLDGAYTLDFHGINDIKIKPKVGEIKHIDIMKKFLKLARRRGFRTLQMLLFPNKVERFWKFLKNIWIIGELLFLVLGLGLSIYDVTTTDTESVALYSWIELAFASLGSLLATVDAVGSLWPCEVCSNALGSCCDRCHFIKSCLNTGRILITELIITPLIICDLFSLFIEQDYKCENENQCFKFAHFILDVIGTIIFLYFVRIFVLVATVRSIYKIQSPEEGNAEKGTMPTSKPQVEKRAFKFTVFLVIHTALQLFAHFIMIVAVGAQIRYENNDLYVGSVSSCGNYCASSLLIYMTIAACILPILGLFSYFVYTNFWFQECPISVLVDFMHVIVAPGGKDIIEMKETKKIDKTPLLRVINSISNNVENNFQELVQTNLTIKLLYPFQNSVCVAFCIFYAACQLAFYIAAGLAYTSVSRIVDSQWLSAFTIFGGVYLLIINIYVFIIAAYWFTVIVILTTLQVIEILIYLAWCLCVTCDILDHPCEYLNKALTRR